MVVWFCLLLENNCIFLHLDYAKGFGGKYGVQKDHVDKSAVGYEYQANLSMHESQKGICLYNLTSFFSYFDSYAEDKCCPKSVCKFWPLHPFSYLFSVYNLGLSVKNLVCSFLIVVWSQRHVSRV